MPSSRHDRAHWHGWSVLNPFTLIPLCSIGLELNLHSHMIITFLHIARIFMLSYLRRTRSSLPSPWMKLFFPYCCKPDWATPNLVHHILNAVCQHVVFEVTSVLTQAQISGSPCRLKWNVELEFSDERESISLKQSEETTHQIPNYVKARECANGFYCEQWQQM